MSDLGIIEILIAFFLFMPLAAPHIKLLAAIDGFLWLGPLALFCIIAVFPAYGFRPECIPLFIYTIIYNLGKAPRLFSSATGLRYLDTPEHGILSFFVSVLFLAATSFLALYYLPLTDTGRLDNARVFTRYDIPNNTEYYIRVYEGSSDRPIILTMPPVLGSVSVIDKVCGALAREGLTVVSFSRKSFDIPAFPDGEHIALIGSGMNITHLKKMVSSLRSGWKTEKANSDGRYFEEQRTKDLDFMLAFIKRDFPSSEFYVLAYGSSGFGLVTLAASTDVERTLPQLKGGIIIESRLYSLFEPDKTAEVPAKTGGIDETFHQVREAITGKQNLTVRSSLPQADIPLLYVIAGETAQADTGPYQAAFAYAQANEDHLKLLVMPDVNATDMSDVPEKYPLLSALLRRKSASIWENHEAVQTAAHIIMNGIR